MNSVIILAAGSGSRMNGRVADKTLTEINNTPVFLYSIKAFIETNSFEDYVIVYRDELQKSEMQAHLLNPPYINCTIRFIQGGDSRQASVLQGLSICSNSDYVAIHDSARPLITSKCIANLVGAALKHGNAIPFAPIYDTIQQVQSNSPNSDLMNVNTIDRNTLRAIQTPQIFSFDSIYKAYQKITLDGLTISDDSSALSHIDMKLHLVENSEPNPKITTKKDLDYILYLLNQNTT